MEYLIGMIGWSISAIFFLVAGIVIYKKCGYIEKDQGKKKTS